MGAKANWIWLGWRFESPFWPRSSTRANTGRCRTTVFITRLSVGRIIELSISDDTTDGRGLSAESEPDQGHNSKHRDAREIRDSRGVAAAAAEIKIIKIYRGA